MAKIGLLGQKQRFRPPPQKKRSLLDSNNDLKKFWMLFGIKPIFGQKKTFRLNVKTTVSPFGPDRIRRHSWSFCDGPHISTKFCWNSPRIRVLILVIGEWPETTKKRGEPWKMTHGGPNGKVVAPGILVICPVYKNRDFHTENWLFAQNIQIFGSDFDIFFPRS